MVVVRAPGGTPCASSVAQVEQSKRPALNSCPPNKKVFHQIRAMKTMQLLPPRSLLTSLHLLHYSGTSAASTRPHLRFSPPEATSFPTVAAWAQVLDNESPVTMLLARAPDVEVWALTVEARGHVMCWIFAYIATMGIESLPFRVCPWSYRILSCESSAIGPFLGPDTCNAWELWVIGSFTCSWSDGIKLHLNWRWVRMKFILTVEERLYEFVWQLPPSDIFYMAILSFRQWRCDNWILWATNCCHLQVSDFPNLSWKTGKTVQYFPAGSIW